MIELRGLDTKLNYLMCMDIAGLDKFDFHDLSRKLSNKYVGRQMKRCLSRRLRSQND